MFVTVIKGLIYTRKCLKNAKVKSIHYQSELTSLRIWIAQSKREKQKYQIVLKYSIRFIDEGTISDSDLRMLINRIIISEKDGKLDINIILNVKFKEHTLNFDEVQILN